MKAVAKLTPREAQIAELLAWGHAKKEVAEELFISVRTVENTARNIYEKIGIQKATELCVWWFCTNYGISFDLNPLKRTVIACSLLIIFLPYEFNSKKEILRTFRPTRTVRLSRSGRRQERELDLTNYL